MAGKNGGQECCTMCFDLGGILCLGVLVAKCHDIIALTNKKEVPSRAPLLLAGTGTSGIKTWAAGSTKVGCMLAESFSSAGECGAAPQD
jgi:hypothetical protein